MKYTLIPGESCTTTEEEMMSTIRSVLTNDTTPSTPKKLHVIQTRTAPATEDVQPVQQRAFVERTSEGTPRRRASDLPELEAADQVAPRVSFVTRLASRLVAFGGRPLAALRGFQPTTRHLALASAALLFVVRPHWFVIGALLALLLVIGTFMTLGADRIWHGILAWLDRVEARDPARAAALRCKLDRFACRWDGVLDIFPDGMVDSLYMPDFQAMKQAEANHDAVVSDRLNRMVQEG